jgi:2-polyprenyl-6-methoxyphenol hydroxylase-like FAD-dependent oxidoreductase
MPQNFDIVIIGGSFAGMTAALALSNVSEQLKIAIVEKQDILKSDRKRDGRAYAISATSLKLFKEIGIFEQVAPQCGRGGGSFGSDSPSFFSKDCHFQLFAARLRISAYHFYLQFLLGRIIDRMKQVIVTSSTKKIIAKIFNFKKGVK